jgi:hypothetical protein
MLAGATESSAPAIGGEIKITCVGDKPETPTVWSQITQTLVKPTLEAIAVAGNFLRHSYKDFAPTEHDHLRYLCLLLFKNLSSRPRCKASRTRFGGSSRSGKSVSATGAETVCSPATFRRDREEKPPPVADLIGANAIRPNGGGTSP